MVAVVISCLVIVVLGSYACYYALNRRHKKSNKDFVQPYLRVTCLSFLFFIFVLYLIDSLIPYSGNNENLWKISHKNINGDDSTDQEFPYIDLASIKISTNNSSDSNKLGEGGLALFTR